MQRAFIGFGEAAQAFLEGWEAADACQDLPTPVRAFDIKTDRPETREQKHADYDRWSVLGCDDAAQALKGANAVFSLVTADQALNAAQNAARHIEAGAFYFDGNSCSPGTKTQAAQAIEARGGRYVDMAIMAPVHPALHRVAVLLSGPHAQAGAELLNGWDMRASVKDGPVGAASSVKMVRSIMVKGLEALTLECVLSGVQAGVAEDVLRSLEASYPGFGWTERAAYMMERVATHGIRRAAEMREVAKTVEELGLNPDVTAGTIAWQQRVGELGLNLPEGEAYAARAAHLLDGLCAAPNDQIHGQQAPNREAGE